MSTTPNGPDRDELGDLRHVLSPDVVPMAVPPGAHEAVLRGARRRRARTAAALTGAVAVVVGIVVAVPVLTVGGPSGEQVAEQPITATPAPTTAAPQPTDPPSTTAPFVDDGRSTGPVPSGFAPASVTFVSTTDGWTLGQAPCSAQPCTSIARTSDGGASWVGTAAPRTGDVQGRTGVDQLRFGDTRDGWAFGGELWSTHDGTSWDAVALPSGTAVVSLAANGTRAVAAYARCDTTGACTSSTLRSAASSGDDFTALPGASTLDGRADVVLHGGTVWAVSTSGGTVELVRGAADGSAAVTRLDTPCAAGTTAARLAAGSDTALALACTQRDGTVGLYRSADGGTSWGGALPLGSAGAGASPSGLAVSPDGVVLLASRDGGVTRITGGSAARTVLDEATSFVGWTTTSQAVALPATPTSGRVYLTRDGGDTWTTLSVT